MKQLAYGFIFLLTLIATASAQADAWYYKWMGIMDNIGTVPENERIETLSRVLGVGRKPALTPEESTVFHRAQSTLLAIPGHAQYYQDKIEAIREQVKANASLSPEEKERMRRKGNRALELGDYERGRHDAFAVLARLPGPEAVAVLGHFLEDPEGRDGKDMLGNPLVWHDDVPPAFPNCGLACFSITTLGIEHAPISDVNQVNYVAFDPAQVDLWKDWWQEVKSGRRTYRFKGSAIEYGADGPASKRAIERVEKERERAGEARKGRKDGLGQDGLAVDGGVLSKAALTASILAGVAVLASLIWYFRKAEATRRW